MAADGSVVFSVSADDKDAQKKLAQLRRDIEKTANALNDNTTKHSAIVEQLQTAREEAEKTAEFIKELQAQYQENAGVLSGRTGDVSPDEFAARQQAQSEITYELKQQEAIYNRQVAAVAKLEGQEQSLSQKIAMQTGQLEEQEGAAGEIERTFGNTASNVLPQLQSAVEGVSKSVRKAARNILKWGFGIRSTFILMRRLRNAIKEGINTFAEYDDETKASINGLKTSLQQLKVSWGAAFAPIINAVAPLLERLINLLITAANYIQMFFAVLRGGSSYKKVIASNEALAKSYGGAGGAAEDAKKSVMGFDELNKLDDTSSGGGGAGGGESPVDVQETDIDARFADIINKIKENLALLELALGGFLLGLGAILTFSGANIPLGLGLMAAGAVLLAQSVKEDWSAVSPKIASAIAEIMVILGMGLFAIGAILAFSGANIPLGIGMMIAGVTSVAAVALNWDNLPDTVQKTIRTLMIALGAGMLVIGAILAFSGANIPLGIAMMVAGGLALGFGLAHVDWDAVSDKIRGIKDKIVSYMDKLKTKWQEMIDKANEMKDKITEKFTAIRDGIREKIDNIRDKIGEAIDKIKEFFNFKWELPHIQLPHITVSWEAVSADNPIAKLLGIGGIPHFGIQWYAKGGIVNGATLFGAGEDGKEAIVPLEKNMEWVKTVANGIIDGLIGNNRFADAITDAMIPAFASGQIVPPRALSNGGSLFSDRDIDRLVNGIVSAFTMGGEDDHVTKLYLDGQVIAECVTKYQRRMERA